MADIKQLNVGGIDYDLKDNTARTNASNALSQLAYQETGNTASQAYSVVGTPINWKGTLYYTKTAVAKNATWQVGTNLTLAPNLGKLTSNIKTYVNGSGELVFRDLTGADTVLPFSGTSTTIKNTKVLNVSPFTYACDVGDILYCVNNGTTPETVSGGTILDTKITNGVGLIVKATSTTVTFSGPASLVFVVSVAP